VQDNAAIEPIGSHWMGAGIRIDSESARTKDTLATDAALLSTRPRNDQSRRIEFCVSGARVQGCTGKRRKLGPGWSTALVT